MLKFSEAEAAKRCDLEEKDWKSIMHRNDDRDMQKGNEVSNSTVIEEDQMVKGL